MPDELMRRPARLGPRHASMFRLGSVAASYGNRPPYPEETIGILAGLIPSGCRRVLDVGCGTGLIARPLALLVDEVDALDPSAAMIEVGGGLPGGDRANLFWMRGTAEEGALRPPYGLMVAATSFHWFQWDVALPRLAAALAPDGLFAVVEALQRGGPDLGELIPRWSTNQDFGLGDDYDWGAELVRRGLLIPVGRRETAWVPHRQSFDDFVDGWHSMGGFSRERLGPQAVADLDRELRTVLARAYPSGWVEMEVGAAVAWARLGGQASGG